jgi:hypothetical protein
MNFYEKFSQIFPDKLFSSEGHSGRRSDMMNLTVEFRNFWIAITNDFQMNVKSVKSLAF